MQRSILAVAASAVVAAVVVPPPLQVGLKSLHNAHFCLVAATGLSAANALEILFRSLYAFHNHLGSDFFSAVCKSRLPSLARGFE